MATRTEIRTAVPGTFYRRPGPDEEAFVGEGEPVVAGQVIGLVEVMKMFHEITSDRSGRLLEFLAEDGDAVMMGDPVAAIEEAGEQGA